MREPRASQEEIPMTNQDIMDLVTCFDRSTARTMGMCWLVKKPAL